MLISGRISEDELIGAVDGNRRHSLPALFNFGLETYATTLEVVLQIMHTRWFALHYTNCNHESLSRRILACTYVFASALLIQWVSTPEHTVYYRVTPTRITIHHLPQWEPKGTSGRYFIRTSIVCYHCLACVSGFL